MTDAVKVVSQWASLVQGFNTSALDFYKLVEARVSERQAPDLSFARKNFKEGHVFSAPVESIC